MSPGYGDDASTTVTTYGAPVRPSDLTAVRHAPAHVTLKWHASRSSAGAPVTGYSVWVGGHLAKRLPKSARSYSVGGVKKGKTYTFTVKATNRHGASAPLKLTRKWKK